MDNVEYILAKGSGHVDIERCRFVRAQVDASRNDERFVRANILNGCVAILSIWEMNFELFVKSTIYVSGF